MWEPCRLMHRNATSVAPDSAVTPNGICQGIINPWAPCFVSCSVLHTIGTKKMCLIAVSPNQIVTLTCYFVLWYTDIANVVYRTRQSLF